MFLISAVLSLGVAAFLSGHGVELGIAARGGARRVEATAAVGACNTAEGVGKDVEKAGDAVQDTAKDVKKKM